MLLTSGDGGCHYKWLNHKGFLPAYKVRVVDTTGAGDSFVSALLFQIARNEVSVNEYTDDMVRSVIDFAERAGAIVVTKPGAIPSMPSFEQVKNFKAETY